MNNISVKVIGEYAKTPTAIPGNSSHYQLYAAEDITFFANKSRTVNAGMQMPIPNGCDIDFITDMNLMKNGMMINRFPVVGEFLPKLEGQTPMLSYMVFNPGPRDVFITKGQPLGQFRFVRTLSNIDFVEVESFDKVEKNPRMSNVISIPKDAMSYFQRMYFEDRDKCIDLFLIDNVGTQLMIDLEGFKTTAEWQTANNKALSEAKFLWTRIRDDQVKLNQVNNIFRTYKEKMTIMARSS